MVRSDSSESLKRKIYHSIFERIIRKEFPGNAILTEGELTKMFGVSKAPVREALIELCSENVLKSIPRAGYRIIQLTEKDFRDAVDLRVILELEGLRRINSIDAKAFDALEANVEQGKWVSRGDRDIPVDLWWKNNTAFHVALNRLANNCFMTDALENTLNLQWRALAQVYWDTEPMSYLSYESPAHADILAALRGRDIAEAERALKEDLKAVPVRLHDFWIAKAL